MNKCMPCRYVSGSVAQAMFSRCVYNGQSLMFLSVYSMLVRYGTEPTNPLNTVYRYIIVVAIPAVVCILEMNLSVICRYVIDYYDGDLDPGSHRLARSYLWKNTFTIV